MPLERLFNKIIESEDAKRSKIFSSINENRNTLRLLDVGAAGGLEPRWKTFERLIEVVFVEADKRSSDELKKNNCVVIENGLWREETSMKFYLTKKPTVSSFYKPNRRFTDMFPDSSRFNVVEEVSVNVTSIDKVVNPKNQPDFIKLDAQGAALDILTGASKTLKQVLGLEVEVEFKQLYQNQPLYYEIVQFLEGQGFSLLDFTVLRRWERDAYSGFGELIHGDALFLRTPEKIIEMSKESADPMRFFETYLKILFVYSKLDLIKQIFNNIPEEIRNADSFTGLISYLEEKRRKLIFMNRLGTRLLRLLVSKDISIHWLT